MKIFPITAAFLMAGLTLAPLAGAAPSQSKKATSSKQAKGSGTAKRKSQPEKATPKPSTPAKPAPPSKPAPKPMPKPELKPDDTSAPKPAPAPKQEQPTTPEQTPAPAPAQQEPAPAPATPEPAPAPTVPEPAPAAPAEPDKEGYAAFIAALNNQFTNNTYDCCPAVNTVLKYTDEDEFAVIDWMKKAAGEGNAAALHYVASIVLSSPLTQGFTPEADEALAMLKQSADKGFIPAQLDYAIFLRTGRGVKKDEKASENILMQACKSGDMQARFKWLLLTERLKKAEDLKRPEVKYEIDRGNHYVLFYMLYHFQGEERAKMMEQAAKLGNSDALYLIATQAANTDPKKSLELFNIAVDEHNENAIYVMAVMLLHPKSSKLESVLQENHPLGMQLLKTSFLMGNPEAGVALAGIYYEGTYGVEQNRVKAFRHYQQAYRDHADATAQAAMGLMLLKGDGTPQDLKKGREMLEAANKAQAPNAPILMAYANYEGLGYEKDAAKALEILQSAPFTPYSYLFMAFIYAQGGVNVEPDPGTADSYVRMAELDMGDLARKLFDKMMAEGKWDPHP